MRLSYMLPIMMSIYKGKKPYRIVKCWKCENLEKHKTIRNIGYCRVHDRMVHTNGHCYVFENEELYDRQQKV